MAFGSAPVGNTIRAVLVVSCEAVFENWVAQPQEIANLSESFSGLSCAGVGLWDAWFSERNIARLYG